MIGHPLRWAGIAVTSGVTFMTAVAFLLSPGQDAVIAQYRQEPNLIRSSNRFAPARAPIVSGLQHIVPVRIHATSGLGDVQFSGAALMGTRESNDPQSVNTAALADFNRAPRNVPTSVFIPGANTAPEPRYVPSRNASYIAGVIHQAPTGIATWYGGGFHGNQMYCGQISNMYDPTTAASTDFPCGTWLTVMNVTNGATIRVQVRDRGLLGPGHVDLSLAAFGAIADPGDGVVDIAVYPTGAR